MPIEGQIPRLGEVPVDNTAFELDLKINEGYQAYSKELLRLSLLAIAGVSTIWLRLFLPGANSSASGHVAVTTWFLVFSFICLVISSASALIHRYTAADSLAYHLTGLRRRKRNRPESDGRPSDVALAQRNDAKRDKLFKLSDRLLKSSVGFLLLGIVLFGIGLCPFMR